MKRPERQRIRREEAAARQAAYDRLPLSEKIRRANERGHANTREVRRLVRGLKA